MRIVSVILDVLILLMLVYALVSLLFGVLAFPMWMVYVALVVMIVWAIVAMLRHLARE